MRASGDGPKNATRIVQLPVNRSYEITVRAMTENGAAAGLGMISSHGFVGLELSDGKVIHPRRRPTPAPESFPNNDVWLRIRNMDHDVTFFYSADGVNWSKHEWGAALSTEATQRIILFASGDGDVTFKRYSYRGL